MDPTRLTLLIYGLTPVGDLVIEDPGENLTAKKASAYAQWKTANEKLKAGRATSLSLPGLSGSLVEGMAPSDEVAEWEAVWRYLSDLAANGEVTAESQAGSTTLMRSLAGKPLTW